MNEQRTRIWYTTRDEELVYPIDLLREHSELFRRLRRAHSAQKALALEYKRQAAAMRDPWEKKGMCQIENDEWKQREILLGIMKKYGVPVSLYYEVKYRIIGKIISIGSRMSGRFVRFYFAGKQESENVCEYFRMMKCFHSLGVHNHDRIIYALSMNEREHERYFLNNIRNHKLLPLFEKIFSWGRKKSSDHLNLEKKYGITESAKYCAN